MASLKYCKKMKAEPSRLIAQKRTENQELLIVVSFISRYACMYLWILYQKIIIGLLVVGYIYDLDIIKYL